MVAAHVAGVTRLDIGDQAVHVGRAAMGLSILEAAFGADMDAGGDEDLGISKSNSQYWSQSRIR